MVACNAITTAPVGIAGTLRDGIVATGGWW